MNVLLSIKPKYVEQILNGNKKYEFRKAIFKNFNEVDTIYIYSSAPVKKIVASFKVDAVFESHPKNLWRKYNKHSGIDKECFFAYFENRSTGFAIKIGKLQHFKEHIEPKNVITNFVPPQSFCYVSGLVLAGNI